MNDRLFINGEELDMNPLKRISETYQVNDLFDFKDRQTSFTSTFSIPRTANNVNILQGLGLVGSTSNVPYQLNALTYFREGTQVFSNATAIVKETGRDFKLNAYFGNNSLFEVIANKKLSELDLSSLDHDLTITNYIQRLDGENLIYAVANYGGQIDNTIVVNYQTPALKLAYLWDKIFADAGFTYSYAGRGGKNDYNVFLSDLWKKEYITLDQGFDNNIEKTEPLPQLTAKNQQEFSHIYYSYFKVPFEMFNPLFLSNVNFSSYENISIQNYNSYIIFGTTVQGKTVLTFKNNNYYRLKMNGTIVASQIQELELRVKNNDIIIETIEISEGIVQLAFDKRYYFETGNNLSFEFYAKNEYPKESVVWSTDLSFDISIDNQEVAVNLSNYFNGITQKDFLKDRINFFGLTYKRVGNDYQFISYRELFDINASYKNFNPRFPVNFVADDWSEKYDSIEKENYNIGDYGQRNLLKYQYDNETDTFADGVLKIDDTTLPYENEIFTRFYKAPSASIFQIENTTIRKMKLYEIEEDKIKPLKSSPYVFYAEKKSGAFNFKIEGGTLNTYNGNYYLATFKDLSWTEQSSKYLFTLQNLLNKTKKQDVRIALTEIDIKTLDFFKLKYIKQLGSYFYLNKVNGFTNDATTICELIKVGQQAQLGQFSDDFSTDFNI